MKYDNINYKAGDKITIQLSDAYAAVLNATQSINIYKDQIIAHEPAPEPIVEYFKLNGRSFVALGCYPEPGCIKLTVNPATKQASVEVVG